MSIFPLGRYLSIIAAAWKLTISSQLFKSPNLHRRNRRYNKIRRQIRHFDF